MSELLISYTDHLPERCKTCPVFLAFLHQAELAEKAATKHTRDIEGVMRGQSMSPNPMDRAKLKIAGMYLDVSTELEMQCTNAVAQLIKGVGQCPGDPNADALYIFPLSLDIVSSIKQGLICQNPNLDTAVAEIRILN